MKLFRNAALAATLLTASAIPAAAATYTLDTKGAHASINFAVKHLGYSWLTGRFDNFSGTFDFDKDAPEKAAVSVEIDTTSVNSNHEARDKHLRSADFLNVDAHPKATFKSTKVEVTGDKTAKITGDFTLNGVTKPVVIDTTYIGGGDDPWGGFRQGFMGKTSIEMSDFGFKKDYGTVQLELHAEGIRQ